MTTARDTQRLGLLDLAASVATIRAGRADRGAGADREAPSAGAGGTTLALEEARP